MQRAVIALSFFLTSAGLFAQTAMPWSSVSGCPVSLRAEQISSANMMHVRKGQPQQWGQRLHLTFASHDTKQIVAATVNVRGFGSTPGVIMDAVAKPSTGSPALVTRTIQITFTQQAGAAVAADILVPDVTATQTIDLAALTYADGTSWNLAEGQTCRITPDPLMLIGLYRHTAQ